MKLFAHPFSSYSQKALIALYESGADVLTATWKVDGVLYARDDYSTRTIRHELYGDDASLELIVEETPTSSGRGLISIRKTYLAADSSVPYIRESYEWDEHRRP